MKPKPLSFAPSPFVFSGLRLESASLAVLVTLFIQIVLMAVFGDARSLIVILASLIGAAAAEACFVSPVSCIGGKCKKFSDGAAAISGLAAGFLLPSAVNPFLAGLAAFFGLFISRNFFNGKGNAWINASALSVIFVFISAPSYFNGLEALSPADFDYWVTAFLNGAFFRPLGIALPEGYVSLFFNPASPVPAFKFCILTLVSSIILVALDAIDWIAPAVFLLVYAACIFLFSAGGNILFALFSGGVFFAAVYLLSDFSTLPRTRTGRAVLGALAGIIAFFACGASTPVFVVFAANLCSPVIEYAENRILTSTQREMF